MAAKKIVSKCKTVAPRGATLKAKAAATGASARLTPADIKLLTAVANTSRPDVSVRDAVQEGKDLIATCNTYGLKLFSHGGLAKSALKELPVRTERLERGERTWTDERDFAAKGDVVAVRKACTAEKQLVMAALRHFLRDEREIQVRLDHIAEGSGDVDLADDASKLADLVDANRAALKTPEITKSTSTNLRDLATKLSAHVSERNVNIDASDAITLRNRSFWHLRALVAEIQSAARFVYRNDPKVLKHFRSLRSRS